MRLLYELALLWEPAPSEPEILEPGDEGYRDPLFERASERPEWEAEERHDGPPPVPPGHIDMRGKPLTLDSMAAAAPAFFGVTEEQGRQMFRHWFVLDAEDVP